MVQVAGTSTLRHLALLMELCLDIGCIVYSSCKDLLAMMVWPKSKRRPCLKVLGFGGLQPNCQALRGTVGHSVTQCIRRLHSSHIYCLGRHLAIQ